MSPEQARGKEVDARTDVFAFGVMLFEMVTGERPFAGETTHDVLAAVTRDAPRRPSELNALVPAGVERIVERCLEKLPEARYANGHELADALLAMHQRPSASQPSVGPGASTRATASVLTPAASSVRTEHRRSARGWVLLVAPSSSPALPTPVGESPSEVPAPVSARQLEGVAGPPR
jgi:serine/threonine-protein kinase